MNTLHHHSVISAPYELPDLSRPAEQPYGIIFGECKAGASISFDRGVPFHLLFLLKGAACVKVGGKTVDIFCNEFLMMDSALSPNCLCIHPCHYVWVGMDKELLPDMKNYTGFHSVEPQPIPADLAILLRYLMGTMPLNEKMNHHLMPRIVRAMMQAYSYTMVI